MIGRLESNPTGRNISPRGRSAACHWLLVTVSVGVVLVGGLGRARAQTPSMPAAPTRPKASITRVVPIPSPSEAPAPIGEPVPGGLRYPDPRGADAPPPLLDPQITPAAAELMEPAVEPMAEVGGDPLPGATEPPPGNGTNPGASPASGGGDPADPFTLRPDRLATGKQKVQLSVDVRSAGVINLGKETSVRIVVTNDGTTDAYGVAVVYQLPESLEFVSSESPPIKDAVNPRIYTWNKSMMAAGGEWSIGMKVVPKDTKTCEHVAHVRANIGTKALVMVQEPKLRVEAVASPSRILKGKPVNYEITVSNPGTGPARNINVQAKLSGGLRLGEDDLVEQTIELIKPGERIKLEALPLDTVAGGEQACDIEVRSSDVNYVAADHHIKRAVDVIEPKLDVTLTGPDFRYTGQTIEYKLSVTNPGDAPAIGVVLSAAMPQQGGKLAPGPLPGNAIFVVKDRKLFWKIARLEPKQTIENRFIYETSAPGLYRCAAEATSGTLQTTKQMNTEVSGIADLDLKVEQTDRVIDVGKSTYYDFVIRNLGTKEATKLSLSGTLVNVEVKKPFYDQSFGEFMSKEVGPKENQTSQFVFPLIPRLAAGQSITVSLEVVATRGGKASASVSLGHDEMGNDENAKIKGAITTTVTDLNRAPPR